MAKLTSSLLGTCLSSSDSSLSAHSLVSFTRKRAEYGFGEYGFKHRAQWVFWPSPSSGERAQWVPLSLLFACQSKLTEFVAEITEFAAELREFSLPKQYSRNGIPPVSYLHGSQTTEVLQRNREIGLLPRYLPITNSKESLEDFKKETLEHLTSPQNQSNHVNTLGSTTPLCLFFFFWGGGEGTKTKTRETPGARYCMTVDSPTTAFAAVQIASIRCWSCLETGSHNNLTLMFLSYAQRSTRFCPPFPGNND